MRLVAPADEALSNPSTCFSFFFFHYVLSYTICTTTFPDVNIPISSFGDTNPPDEDPEDVSRRKIGS
jgi:hypothetical protein